MKRFFTSWPLFLLFCLAGNHTAFTQNSVLVNFGSPNCYNAGNPFFSLINNPLSASPSALASCGLTAQLPDFYNVFIAYNPKSNKIYVADIRSNIDTKIWVMDMGLPSNIACPVIPVAPTYSYSYISNNFEFDNNGDLWSFSNYNLSTGRCNMDKFDVTTGSVINTRILQFPPGNFPTSINSGDLTILPNGRMFATLGSAPSRLYEINNYSSTSNNATATYLQTLPKDCYGIAYLNGQLEVTGIDFTTSSCYYFDYTISTNTLGIQKPFQLGQGPIDNTSFTPSVGTTKQLVNAVKVNANTADLTYEIYVKNLGNVIINNINVTDDLGAVFGAANVSNVSTSFVAGANMGGLTLNSSYNGTTITSLLSAGQNLPNQTLSNTNYYFKLLLQCRVTNLQAATTYLNSAIGQGTIGNTGNSSLINIKDSSNNGPASVVDPNSNGNASELGENVPTPFNFGTLPVRFISVAATLTNKTSATVKWVVATPTINAEKFEVEYSVDGRSWIQLTAMNITSINQGNYQFTHRHIPAGNLYYRIRQTDNDGSFVYSRIVLLHNKLNANNYTIFPNPAGNYIQVSAPYYNNGKTSIEMYDATGRKILSKQMTTSTEEINTAHLPAGTFLLKLIHKDDVQTQKVLIVH
ncbi:MAG: T9SS type A sorting domain-containing protein [Ferruginibacter sp.]|nr:T9SS type A sorting domain-containing protein [Ferruginibacter sp.]